MFGTMAVVFGSWDDRHGAMEDIFVSIDVVPRYREDVWGDKKCLCGQNFCLSRRRQRDFPIEDAMRGSDGNIFRSIDDVEGATATMCRWEGVMFVSIDDGDVSRADGCGSIDDIDGHKNVVDGSKDDSFTSRDVSDGSIDVVSASKDVVFVSEEDVDRSRDVV